MRIGSAYKVLNFKSDALLVPPRELTECRASTRRRFVRNWWFSVLMLIAYIAVFHLWLWDASPLSPFISATVWAIFFAALLYAQRTYFINAWDRAFHAIVIIDVLVESLIPFHSGYGFYLCAAAFAIVIGGYRYYLLRPKQDHGLPIMETVVESGGEA